MSERRAFVDAIRANPDDRGLPLVFADWLDDNGEADLATGIRLHMAVDWDGRCFKRLGTKVFWDCDCRKCQPARLWNNHVSDKSFHNRYRVNPIGAAGKRWFHHGLIHTVWCELAGWRSCGWDLVDRWPITRVILTDGWRMGHNSEESERWLQNLIACGVDPNIEHSSSAVATEYRAYVLVQWALRERVMTFSEWVECNTLQEI